MKVNTKWLRRSAVLVLGACLVTALAGCDWFDDDEDGSDFLPTVWRVSWTPDADGVGPLDIPVDVDSLNDITNFSGTYGSYTVVIGVTGSDITIDISDSGSQFDLSLMGTIAGGGLSASGNYAGTESDGDPIQGTWSVAKL